jgi:putative transposase
MPGGPRTVLENALYHIMVRGNRKQKIFMEKADFEKYLLKMRKYKKRHRIKLYGFCLMPNHVHMIGEVSDKGSLAKFMHGLNRSYTAYFNEKYDKVGHLWQGRFKSKIILKDRYAIDCVNYIELNPVRARLVSAPHEYNWSSYKDRVLNLNSDKAILDTLAL